MKPKHNKLIRLIKENIFLRIWNSIGEGALKNKLRCFYHNRKIKGFHASYNNNIFNLKFSNGISFKSYDNLIMDLGVIIQSYFKNYKLKKGDIVVDGGAYLGLFTLYASKSVGEKGLVIAFEPQEEFYNKLSKSLKLNNINNVILIKKALWSKDTTLSFYKSGQSSSLFPVKNKPSEKIQTTKLDDELSKRKIKKVDFIKLDIESAEIEAIKGMKKTLKYNPNLAIASYHILNEKPTYIELEKLLPKFGYKVETTYPKHLTTYAEKI